MSFNKIIAIAAAMAAIIACNKNSAQQMSDASSNVGISCTPEVLTVVNNDVPVSITVDYPAAYFTSESKLEVIPVIVYEGGEMAGPTFRYQGDKVRENNKVISSSGGSVTESFSFPFVDGMQKCYLELRSKAVYKDKTVVLPSRKVADGVILTGNDFVASLGQVDEDHVAQSVLSKVGDADDGNAVLFLEPLMILGVAQFVGNSHCNILLKYVFD